MKRIYKFFMFAAIMSTMTACSDWDNHYDSDINAGNGLTLMQMLETDDNTTTFARLVRKSGYADLLSSSQSFTVFAPYNNALTGLDESDITQLKLMITNHIARHTYPSSTPANEGVRMMDGKVYNFDNTNSFAGRNIITSDRQAANGVIHHVSSQIPYINNIYEFIQSNPNTSKLYEFIHQFDEMKMDEKNSQEIGIDEEGRPVYDTVLVKYNRLLDDKLYGLGCIDTEDSTYTMLIPDNNAWTEAYKRIAPTFANYNADQTKADSIQDVRTCMAIMNDLIYREAPETPASADSLISTDGSVIHNPSLLFGNATRHELSNGNAFVVSSLNYDNTETWQKEISIEGETQNGRTYNNTSVALYTHNVTDASLVGGASNGSYIEVSTINTVSQAVVTFSIPGVLAGKYNVYAVFLPPTIEGEVDSPDSTYISFNMQYMNARGGNTTKNSNKKDTAHLTSGSRVVKMLAFEEIEFPVSDCTDRLWMMDEENYSGNITPTTKLSISTNVTNPEFNQKKFGRTFRLDRIIFEPIKQ